MNEIPPEAREQIERFLAEEAKQQAERGKGNGGGKTEIQIPDRLTGMTHSEALRLARKLGFDVDTPETGSRRKHTIHIKSATGGYSFPLPGNTNTPLSKIV